MSLQKPLPDFNALARLDPSVWFALYGVLKDKDGKIEKKRRPNLLQKRMFKAYREAMAAGRPFKCLGLKPRQVGLSTVIAAITYHHMRNHPNITGALMADKTGTADKVFEIFRTFAENDAFDWGEGNGPIAPFGQPGNLANEIILPNGSKYTKETAGSARAAAGGTLQVANGTEVAHFPVIKGKDPALGFLNAWNDEGEASVGMFDTTPNGPTGLFYELWTDKLNGYQKIFAAWFEFPEHSKAFADDEARQAFELSIYAGENKDYEEAEEQKRYNVSLEQLQWRREKIKDKCQNDTNRFRQEYPSNDIECFLLNARLRFRATTVEDMKKRCASFPPEVGDFSMQDDQQVVWRRDEAGTVEVIEHPRMGCRYLVSMDTCTGQDQQQTTGKADPDWHSIGVLRDEYTDAGGNYFPPKIVAHHYSRLESETAALVAAQLSIYYGRCIVIPEVNNCGIFHVKALEAMEIPVYERTVINAVADTVDRHKGWRTDAITRRTIIDNLGALVANWTPEKPTFECAIKWVIDQMATFVRHKSGAVKAMSGKHDDGVLMLAIALYNRGACQLMKAPKRRPPKVDDVNRREGWGGNR